MGSLGAEYLRLLSNGAQKLGDPVAVILVTRDERTSLFSEMRQELFGLGAPENAVKISTDRTGLTFDLLRDERFSLSGTEPVIPRADISALERELGFSGYGRIPGSTFADAGLGPPIPLSRLTPDDIEAERLQRELPASLENWTRLGRQEIAETLRNWLAVGVPSEWTAPRVSEENIEVGEPRFVVREYNSISDVVTDAVRALFGLEPLAPARPVESPSVSLGDLPVARLPESISAAELSRLDRDSAAIIALGYYGPNEPDIFSRYMYSKINDPNHLDLIVFDDKGRALTIIEPGLGPTWRISSPTGLDLVEQLYGCSGSCLEGARADSERAEQEIAERAQFERCGEVPCDAVYEVPPILRVTPPAPPPAPPSVPPSKDAPRAQPETRIPPPPRTTASSYGARLGEMVSAPVTSLQFMLANLIQLLSSLLNLFWGTPSAPAVPVAPSAPALYASFTVDPSTAKSGSIITLAWSSNATECAVYKSPSTLLFRTGPVGSATTTVHSSTAFRLTCARTTEFIERVATVIVQ